MKPFYTLVLLLLVKIASAQVNLDSSFGVNGIVKTFSDKSSEIIDVAVQVDGKVLVVGYTVNLGVYHIQLIRYNSDGSIDKSFGVQGFVNTEIENSVMPYDITIQADEKIILVGNSLKVVQGQTGYYHSIIVRYNPDGDLDTSFGNGGIIKYVISDEKIDDGLSCVNLLSDNSIIASGFVGVNFLTIKLNQNGVLDSLFGYKIIDINQAAHISAMDIDEEDNIYVAGASKLNNGNYVLSILKYNSNGSIDSLFGTNGVLQLKTHDISFSAAVASIKIVDSHLLIAGYSNGQSLLARCNMVNGALDNTFGDSGIVIMPNNIPLTTAMGVQSDKKILITGNREVSPFNHGYQLTRLNSNGSLDTNFGQDGIISIDIDTGNDYVQSMAIQKDHKMILGGSSRKSPQDNSAFTLVRLTSDITSVTEVVNNKKVILFPNPTTDFINIPIAKDRIKYYILDGLGRSVQQGESDPKIDVSNLSNGTYLLHYIDDKEQRAIKFIKD